MSDIGKFIFEQHADITDPGGHMFDLEPWDESLASQRAAELGIDLTAHHWEVVRYLRHHYQCHGAVAHARDLLGDLETVVAKEGGRRFLFTLFPRGPVVQGCYIAGLPQPPGATDPSFGSVE